MEPQINTESCTDNNYPTNYSLAYHNLNHSDKEQKLQNTLKVISLNCCSLRSLEKRARLQAIVEEHRSDIVFGCETHLRWILLIYWSLPWGFTIMRKDRSLGGGGIFLVVSSEFSFLDVSINTDAEMIWAKISPTYGETLFICSFYRPPQWKH